MTRVTGYANEEAATVCVACWAASPARGWAAYRMEVYGDHLACDDLGGEPCIDCGRRVSFMGLQCVEDEQVEMTG
jgi:hypothetical protein